jgi:Catalase
MAWKETYSGGSAEAEEIEFRGFADDMLRLQVKQREIAGVTALDRAFHAKSLLAVDNAELHFRPDLPADLVTGFVQPDRKYPATVRFSNGEGRVDRDDEPDVRGIAVRVKVSDHEEHDFLATNFPVSHARNARQFVRIALAATEPTKAAQAMGLLKLSFQEGPFEVLRMVKNAKQARRKIDSVALESYWSRGALRWGPTLAVRFTISPVDAAPVAGSFANDRDALSKEAAARLAKGPIRFQLSIQRYVDDTKTPIEDTSIAWEPASTPNVPVATLTIPQQDITSAQADEKVRVINAMSFTPWNTTDEFRPLGNLNRSRKMAYHASVALRNTRI